MHAWPQIGLFGQDLVPGRVGVLSGMFFGLVLGMSGSGVAMLGYPGGQTGIAFVFLTCSFLDNAETASGPQTDRPDESGGDREAPAASRTGRRPGRRAKEP